MHGLLLLLLGCADGWEAKDSFVADTAVSTVVDTATGSGTGSDTGSSTGTGTGSGTGTGTGSGTAAFCNQGLSHAPPDGAECMESELLFCGSVVEASNAGGDSFYDGDTWRNWTCTVSGNATNYTGPERGWVLYLDPNTDATVELYTPCANLDLFALRREDDGTCPVWNENNHNCDGDVGTGSAHSLRIMTLGNPETHFLFVDAPASATGNFRLSVTCR